MRKSDSLKKDIAWIIDMTRDQHDWSSDHIAKKILEQIAIEDNKEIR